MKQLLGEKAGLKILTSATSLLHQILWFCEWKTEYFSPAKAKQPALLTNCYSSVELYCDYDLNRN